MKAVIWKNAMEDPSQKLIGAFKAHKSTTKAHKSTTELGDIWIGELTEENIEQCDKSFTVWKPNNYQLTPEDKKILTAAGLTITDDDSEKSTIWILDTYPEKE